MNEKTRTRLREMGFGDAQISEIETLRRELTDSGTTLNYDLATRMYRIYGSDYESAGDEFETLRDRSSELDSSPRVSNDKIVALLEGPNRQRLLDTVHRERAEKVESVSE